MPPLNEQQLNAPAGMSTVDGGFMTGRNDIPTVNTPAPRPTTGVADVPAAAPQPTVAETLAGIKSQALQIQDVLNSRQTAAGGFATSQFEQEPQLTPFDERQASREATRNQMKLFQAEIDATNKVYDQLLNEARIEGEGRLGSQRAVAARGGLLGSDFAGAQKQRVQDFNTDITRGIQNERIAAIGSIMGNVRASVQNEIAAKRQAREAGAEEYLNFLANKSARKQNYVNQVAFDMIAQGYNVSDFSEEELSEIGREAGISANDIIAAYNRANASQEGAEDSQFGFMSSSGGIFRTDPTTGEATFIPSGGSASGGSTGRASASPRTATQRSSNQSEEELTLDAARNWASQNLEQGRDFVKNELMSGGLTATMAEGVLNELGFKKGTEVLSAEQFERNVGTIAIALRKAASSITDNASEELQKAKAQVEKGTLSVGGTKYVLTPNQKQLLTNQLDELGERTLMQRILPGGQ